MNTDSHPDAKTTALLLSGGERFEQRESRPEPDAGAGARGDRTGELLALGPRLRALLRAQHAARRRRLLLVRRAGQGNVFKALPECSQQVRQQKSDLRADKSAGVILFIHMHVTNLL